MNGSLSVPASLRERYAFAKFSEQAQQDYLRRKEIFTDTAFSCQKYGDFLPETNHGDLKISTVNCTLKKEQVVCKMSPKNGDARVHANVIYPEERDNKTYIKVSSLFFITNSTK